MIPFSIRMKTPEAIKVLSPSELVDIEFKPPETTTSEQKESETFSRDSIIKWGGLSTEIISDSELLNLVGLEGNTIPRWYKSNIPAWIMQERTSQEEFVNTLNFFYENGLLNSAN